MTDFDKITDRRGSGSYKWDTDDSGDMLQMWVADMDFRTAPAIIDALRRRVDHGVFGYTSVGREYYDAVTGWFLRRHGWQIDPDWIIYTIGVVPAISAIIKALTRPGDKVITQTPAYNCFFSSIRNNGCQLLANDLIYSDGRYSINFDDLERKASDPLAKILLLCNPHNPSGRVWTPDELRRVGEICRRNGVSVVADEIHCELVYPPYQYTPYGSLGKEFSAHSISCISASKAFNIAGLQIANIVTEDPELRRKIDRAINDNEVCDVNPFGPVATVAAYNHSGEWLDSLVEYLGGNYRLICDEFARSLPELHIVPLEATYLAWIDIRPTGLSAEEVAERIRREAHVHINPGTMYGPAGEGFIRLNFATQRQRLVQALSAIIPTLRSMI